MRSLVINVDSDGVVYDWHGFMIPYLQKKLGVEVTRDSFIEWDLAKSLGVSKSQFYKEFDVAVEEGAFLRGEAIPGAVEGINALVDAGHRVRVVTNKVLKGNAKTRNAEVDTVYWYSAQGLLDKVELAFTGAKWGKAGYPADVVVDDKPDLSWAQMYPATNVIFNQPWNQTVAHPPRLADQVYRAVGWQDVLELVEQMGGGLLLDKSPVVV